LDCYLDEFLIFFQTNSTFFFAIHLYLEEVINCFNLLLIFREIIA
jgi:hypothetical protein